MHIYLARQPIYDRDLNVVAYELLYRAGDSNSAGVIDDPDQASSQVFVNAFVEMNIDNIVGKHPALINVTRSFIEANKVPSNLASRIVLEILETESIDKEFVKHIKKMRDKGYRIALDDFVYDKNWAQLIPYAEMIKYDVMSLGKDGVSKQLKILEKFKKAVGRVFVKTLAEKVETHEEFEYYKSCGFDYFQGYFMAKPKLIKEKGASASKMVVLSLLGELNNPETKVDKLEKLISQDARLTYKLLKVVNSASFGFAKEIDTIQQTIVVLGLDQLRNWTTLLALSLNESKPQELLVTAMVRGKMAQLLAGMIEAPDINPFFTAGLFSLMDALVDLPLNEIVAVMPFSEALETAILKHEGQIGHVLQTVIAYEAGDWGQMEALPGVGSDQLWEVYTGALEWAQVAADSIGD